MTSTTSDIEFRSSPSVTLIDHMGGDASVAMSAWVSYGADDEKRLEDEGRVKGLINFLLRESHMTPFESSAFTFRVECPIFVARELFRHRSASYNEMSGRYTVMPGVFYVPVEERPVVQTGKAGDYTFTDSQTLNIASRDAIITNSASAWESYTDLLSSGVAKEVARMVLPLNLYTQFYVTMNARNLMHFLGLRTWVNGTQALCEIRDVATLMEKSFSEVMPLTHTAWLENL